MSRMRASAVGVSSLSATTTRIGPDRWRAIEARVWSRLSRRKVHTPTTSDGRSQASFTEGSKRSPAPTHRRRTQADNVTGCALAPPDRTQKTQAPEGSNATLARCCEGAWGCWRRSGLRIAYFVHDLNDAAVAKRISMLRSAGAEVRLAGFRRTAEPVRDVAGIEPLNLGRTHDA